MKSIPLDELRPVFMTSVSMGSVICYSEAMVAQCWTSAAIVDTFSMTSLCKEHELFMDAISMGQA